MTRARELLERVAEWPEGDIEKLEVTARRIEAWRAGKYVATDDELRDIDDAEASGIATDQDVDAAFRGRRVVVG
jgi:hypothetical protein